ncbi:MAG: hypothetical protein VX210_08270 [Myxococcota bacterium]|nr:hypothetical protein [Myxococcota bacterium]
MPVERGCFDGRLSEATLCKDTGCFADGAHLIPLARYAKNLKGIQIGLLNFNTNGLFVSLASIEAGNEAISSLP